ncbi:MAG: D-alanine--D-alanine ligase, partial [Chloroflexi bacterium]|nr:D-alanine--D-alanine ligase [Chloroflexota bacterium]
MKIGLAYDLKDEVSSQCKADDALEEYDSVETIDGISTVKLGGGKQFLSNIVNTSVDFVFNISEGRGTFRSREAQVPCVLELLDIPYTGADPQCLAICLDKPLVKRIVRTEGIVTPEWQIVENNDSIKNIIWEKISFPLILKPAYEGSSKGIRFTSIVKNREETIKKV